MTHEEAELHDVMCAVANKPNGSTFDQESVLDVMKLLEEARRVKSLSYLAQHHLDKLDRCISRPNLEAAWKEIRPAILGFRRFVFQPKANKEGLHFDGEWSKWDYIKKNGKDW